MASEPMNDLEILKENNPSLAEYLGEWRSNYQRSYDLTQVAEQSVLHEAVSDLVRNMARLSQSGNATIHVSNVGVTGLTINVVPKT